MAANSRANTGGIAYSENEIVPFGEFNTVDTNAAQSVNRNSTVTGYCALPFIVCASATVEISVNSSGVYQTTAVNGYDHAFPLIGLPSGHVLTAVRLWIIPADAARGGTQPAVMPTLKVFKKLSTLASGTPDQLGATYTATWGSEAAYESGQAMEVSGLAETIDTNSYGYFVVFTGENGADAYAGLKFGGLDASVTIDASYGGPDFTHWRR